MSSRGSIRNGVIELRKGSMCEGTLFLGYAPILEKEGKGVMMFHNRGVLLVWRLAAMGMPTRR